MKTSRARVVRRLGVIVAAAVVVGSYFTGVAMAAGSSAAIVPAQAIPTDVIPSGVVPTGVIPTGVIPTGVIPTNIIPTNIIPTNIIPTGTSASGPSGGNTVIQYSPYPYPVFGDYGHRYYGKYYDNGCGCDRYAAPTYTPQTVVANQVASVPKGGVDTGDGSFQ